MCLSLSRAPALLGKARLISFHIANTGISIAFSIPSFSLVTFWRSDGVEATSDGDGGPARGKGAREGGMLVGEVAVARGDRAPAGEQVPEPFDDGRPCSDLGDEDSRLGVVETVRDCFVSKG